MEVEEEKSKKSLLESVKISVFYLFFLLLQETFKSQFFYCVLLFFDSFQICMLNLYLSREYITDSRQFIFDYDFIFLFFKRTSTISYFLAFLCACVAAFVFSTMFKVLLVRANTAYFSKDKQKIWLYLASPMVYIIVALKHFLGMPLIHLLLSFFTIDHTDLSNITSLLLTVISIAIIIYTGFILVIILLSFWFYTTQEMDSKIPWADCSTMVEFSRFVHKLSLALIITFNRHESFPEIYAGISLFFALHSLFVVYRCPPMKFIVTHYFLMLMQSIILASSLISLLNLLLRESIFNMEYIFLIGPLLWITAIYIKSQNQKNKALKVSSKRGLENKWTIIEIVKLLISWYTNLERSEKYLIKFSGFLNNHQNNCKSAVCKCRKLTIDEMLANRGIVRKAQGNNPNDKSVVLNQRDFYLFLKSIINECMKYESRSSILHIYLSYIDFTCMNENFQGLYQIMEASEYNSSYYEQFLIFSFKRKIELSIEQELLKDNAERVEYLKLIAFHDEYLRFKYMLYKTANDFKTFWKILDKEMPEYFELPFLGIQIADKLDDIKSSFLHLNRLNPSCLKTYVVYCLFLVEIVNDKVIASDIYNGAQSLIKVYADSKGMSDFEAKYGGNSNSAVISISALHYNMGEILNGNYEFESLLGFDPNEIKGENVSVIIPDIIGKHHNTLLKNFCIEGGKRKTRERVVLAKHKNGYLVPCFQFTQIVPNMAKGMQIIGFLQRAFYLDKFRPGDEYVRDKDTLLFLLDKKYRIQGFNRKVCEFCNAAGMNVNKYLMENYKVDFSILFPDIFTDEFINKMHSTEGCIIKRMNLLHLKDTLSYELTQDIDIMHKEGRLTASGLLDFPVSIKMVTSDTPLYTNKSLIFNICTIMPLRPLITADAGNSFCETGSEEGSRRRDTSGILGPLKNLNEERDQELLDVWADNFSQYSASSYTLSIEDTKFIREYKLHVKEVMVPRSVRIFAKFSLTIMFTILCLGVVTLVIELTSYNLLRNVLEITYLNYERLDKTMLVPFYSRLHRNLFWNLEPIDTEIITNRGQFYITKMYDAAEDLRKLQNKIEKYNIERYFPEYEDKYSEVKVVETGPGQISTNVSVANMEYRDVSIQHAVSKMISELSVFAKFTPLTQDPHLMSTVELGVIERSFFYIAENGKYALRTVFEEIAEYVMTEGKGQYKKEKKFTSTISIVMLCLRITSMLCLAPVALIASHNLRRAYLLLIEIKKDDVQKMLTKNNDFSQLICKPFCDIQTFFNSLDEKDFKEKKLKHLSKKLINDEDIKDDDTTNNAIEKYPFSRMNTQIMSRKGSFAGSSTNAIPNGGGKMMKSMSFVDETKMQEIEDEEQALKEDEEEQKHSMSKINLNLEEDKKEIELFEQTLKKRREDAVQKIWKKHSRSIAMNILAVLCFTFSFFLYSSSKGSYNVQKGIKTLEILDILAYRKSFVTILATFYGENIAMNKVHLDHMGNDLFWQYTHKLSDNEQEIVNYQPVIKEYYPEMYALFKDLNSEKMCDYDIYDHDLSPCPTTYNGLLNNGVSASISTVQTNLRATYLGWIYVIPVLDKDKTIILSQKDAINSIDVMSSYIFSALLYSVSKFKEKIDDFVFSIRKAIFVNFVLLVFLLFCVFVFVTVFITRKLKAHIWRIKRMLEILPTECIPHKLDEFHDVIKILN